jgi:EmrB/QacA subfamily drug resistance transporter
MRSGGVGLRFAGFFGMAVSGNTDPKRVPTEYTGYSRMDKTWVLVAAILGSSMSFIDASAVNVALPIIQRELVASSDQMQWVIEAYALFLSALILAGGSLGDLFGRRRLFVIGIAIFAAASLGCAIAPSIIILIVARSVQGIGAALAVPESLALISVSFTGAERGRAIGTWSGFASLTGAAGPLIGGFLAQTASWRWVFIINVPLALVVLAIAVLRVPESRDEHAVHAVDWTGALLATSGLGALVYGLIRLPLPGGRADGTAFAIAGLAVLVAFVIAERRAKHPMMPVTMFRSRTFAIANLYTFALYLALGGSMYFFPYMLIDVQGYTPTAAGATFLPFVILQFGLSRWSGGLIARIGARTPLVAGAAIAGCAFIAYAIPGFGGTYWTTYFPAVLLLGIGATLFIAPLTTTVFDASDPALSGLASAMNNAISRAAALIAIAFFGIIFAGVFAGGFDGGLERAHISSTTRRLADAERAKFIAGTVPPDVPADDRAAVGRAVRTGYLAGFRAVMIVSAGVSFLAALIALLALPSLAAARKSAPAA